jgi:hypothetical protein
MSVPVSIRSVIGALLLSVSGILLFACGSSGQSLSSDSDTPPSVIGSDVGACASPPGHYGAAFVKGTPEIRDNGGTVRVRATVLPDYGIFSLAPTIGAIVRDMGNCFYSIRAESYGHKVVISVGFDGKPGMNPSAVARFLQRQSRIFKKVALEH